MAKRLLDIVGSGLGLILFSPLLVAIAIAIKATSRGPVIFVQDRIGLGGRHFAMLKFRTMVDNAEELGTGLYSFAGDPRVTRLGRFLRRTSLDEVPQLLNVLGGSMSLVGPRPPVTYELGPWEEYTPLMRKRFEVKPGLAGLAQVSGRNDLGWDEKIAFDNRYVEDYARRGVLVDLRILLQAARIVLTGKAVVEVPESPDGEGAIAAKARAAGRPDIADSADIADPASTPKETR